MTLAVGNGIIVIGMLLLSIGTAGALYTGVLLCGLVFGGCVDLLLRSLSCRGLGRVAYSRGWLVLGTHGICGSWNQIL